MPMQMSPMSQALKNKRSNGLDITIILGGANPGDVSLQGSPLGDMPGDDLDLENKLLDDAGNKLNDDAENKALGLAPNGGSNPNPDEEPNSESEQSLVEQALMQGPQRGLMRSKKPKPEKDAAGFNK